MISNLSAFDHNYARWDSLLNANIQVLESGKKTMVDYTALKQNPQALGSVIKEMSSVSKEIFDSWNQAQQTAFLINAYNAFTWPLNRGINAHNAM